MFTIEVEKKGKDEEFGFRHLRLFHQECYGGKIEQNHWEEEEWRLICQRCKQKRDINEGDQTILIIQTAIDGEKREIKSKNIIIIRKTEPKTEGEKDEYKN